MTQPPHMHTDPLRLSMAFWSIDSTFTRKTYTEEKARRILNAWYPDCAPYPKTGWTLADVSSLYDNAYWVIIGRQPEEHLPVPTFMPKNNSEHVQFGAEMIVSWARRWAEDYSRKAL